MASWLDLLPGYAANAASLWPADRPLQARKLDDKVQQRCARLQVSTGQLVE
ncbi:hypothetical protein BGP89_13945 [Luteimonas sp. JM171]|uniref:hypothetical protein n=1 Tax=Luteimonas sp. JM171 TaxID=1896164 RepID=UPI0019127353|nr:hypothetical protein [Luteimonas sp. JM171]